MCNIPTQVFACTGSKVVLNGIINPAGRDNNQVFFNIYILAFYYGGIRDREGEERSLSKTKRKVGSIKYIKSPTVGLINVFVLCARGMPGSPPVTPCTSFRDIGSQAFYISEWLSHST